MIKNILILFCFVKPYCLFQDKYLGSKMLIVAWGYKPRWGGHDAPARNLLTSEGNICHSTLLNFHRKTRTFVRFWISAEQQTKALVCFCVSLYVCLLSVKQALLFVLRWRTFVQFCLAANLLLASQRWKPAHEQTRTLTYGHPYSLFTHVVFCCCSFCNFALFNIVWYFSFPWTNALKI